MLRWKPVGTGPGIAAFAVIPSPAHRVVTPTVNRMLAVLDWP